jgi:hypothetical protein
MFGWLKIFEAEPLELAAFTGQMEYPPKAHASFSDMAGVKYPWTLN